MLTKPRQAVRYIDQSRFLQFILLSSLTFIYFLQLSSFVLSIDKITLAPLLTKKGLLLIAMTLIGLGTGLTSLVYAITLAIWSFAKNLSGQATLQQTRAAVIYAFLWTLPIGFYLLVIYLTIREPDHGSLALGMRIAAYLATPITLIYGFIVLLKATAEMNQFNIWRAFFSVFFGIFSLSLSVYFLVQACLYLL